MQYNRADGLKALVCGWLDKMYNITHTVHLNQNESED